MKKIVLFLILLFPLAITPRQAAANQFPREELLSKESAISLIGKKTEIAKGDILKVNIGSFQIEIDYQTDSASYKIFDTNQALINSGEIKGTKIIILEKIKVLLKKKGDVILFIQI